MKKLLLIPLLAGCQYMKPEPKVEPPPWSPTTKQLLSIEGITVPTGPPGDGGVWVTILWSESMIGPFTNEFHCPPFTTGMSSKFYKLRIENK